MIAHYIKCTINNNNNNNWIFGSHIGFDAKFKVAQKQFFQIVWSKVHETTEKTLTGKRGSFYVARTCLTGLLLSKYRVSATFLRLFFMYQYESIGNTFEQERPAVADKPTRRPRYE